MESNFLKLYSLAKYPYRETFLKSQLETAGANQARLLEKLEKNEGYIKQMNVVLKVVYGVIFAIIGIIPFTVFMEIGDAFNQARVYQIIFTGGILYCFTFLMGLLYLFLFGMINTSAFMTGESFKWLQTLPISKERLRKLSFFTIFRSLDVALIANAASLPIFMYLGSRDIFFTIITAVISIPNVIFSFSILVYASEKLSHVLYRTSSRETKKTTAIRMLVMLSYVGMSMITGFILGWAVSAIPTFFDMFSNLPNADLWTYIFSLIPYPFGPSFLMTLGSIPGNVPPFLWITSIIGFVLFLLVVRFVYKKSVATLEGVVKGETELETAAPKEFTKVQVETRPPIKSYLRKDLITATRDFQTMMFLIMPIIFPFIMIFSAFPAFTETSEFSIIIMWVLVLQVSIYVPAMLVSGLLNMEETGSTILSSLPINTRDQAKAKLLLMISIQTVSYITAPILISILTGSLLFFLLILASIPISWMFLFLLFEMKVILFGKMKYKYVLEELHKEHKVAKWLFMILCQLGLFVGTIILALILYPIGGILALSIGLLIIGSIGLLGLVAFFNYLFPKKGYFEKENKGIRGGLREKPLLGIIVLMLIYMGVLFLPSFIEIPIIFFVSILFGEFPYLPLLFVDFSIQFSLLALFWFYVVPNKLHFPQKFEDIRSYVEKIKLKPKSQFLRNLGIGIGSFLIFNLMTLIGGLLLGEYTFSPEIIFGWPDSESPGITGLGWFLFVIMLIPGIFEEIAFRGVSIPMLQEKHSEKKTLIYSSIVFGAAHAFNLIVVILSGAEIFLTLFQIVYASTLGVALGYMYLRTESLIPCIITHYLIDSVGQLFLNIYFDSFFNLSIFLIVFIAILPVVLIILFVKILTPGIEREK
jgi:membrane protease YdiL (CAAX protease family)